MKLLLVLGFTNIGLWKIMEQPTGKLELEILGDGTIFGGSLSIF